MALPASIKVEIRFGTGAGFGNVLVLGSATDGILGTNVLGTSTADIVDVTSQVQSISTSNGRDRVFDHYDAGNAVVRLFDTTGNWNPENTSSPYYPNVLPMRQLRISATYNSTKYYLFSGYIQSFDYDYQVGLNAAIVTIRAIDAFRLLNLTNISTVAGTAAGDLPGTRVTKILDAASWPSSMRDIDPGTVSMQADPGTSRAALAALQACEDVELGALFASPEGNVVFRDDDGLTEQAAGTRTNAPTRTNLVVNPSFEVNTTGWTASGCTLARSTTEFYIGIAGMTASSTGTSTIARAVITPITVSPSVPYSFSVYVKNVSGTTRNHVLNIRWLTSVGGFAGDTTGTATSLAAGSAWTRITVTGTAPATAATAALWIYFQNTNAQVGNVTACDGVLFEQSSTVNTYFDGSTGYTPAAPYEFVDEAWTGIANNSTSTAIEWYWYRTTFDDDGTDIPYNSVEITLDDDVLANSVTVARSGGTNQTASDAASIATYFQRSLSRTGLLMETDTQALSQANKILGVRKDVKVRVESISLDLSGDSSRVLPAVSLGIGDPITVNRTQPGGSRISVDLAIQGISHTISPAGWSATFTTAEYLGSSFILTSPTYGILGTSTL